MTLSTPPNNNTNNKTLNTGHKTPIKLTPNVANIPSTMNNFKISVTNFTYPKYY